MKKYISILAALAAPILFLAPAYGGIGPPIIIDPPIDTYDTIEGLGEDVEGVNIWEREAPFLDYEADSDFRFLLFGTQVQYAIDILDELSSVVIDFLAVSNQSPGGYFHTTESSSQGQVLDSEEWNTQHGTYGLFSDLFGDEDTHVSVYENIGVNVGNDESFAFFLDDGAVFTEFIVASQGQIIDRSFPPPSSGVPDSGSTLLLLGTAICGMFLGAKRLRR